MRHDFFLCLSSIYILPAVGGNISNFLRDQLSLLNEKPSHFRIAKRGDRELFYWAGGDFSFYAAFLDLIYDQERNI